MAQAAYELEHFTPTRRRAAPHVRVAKRARNARRAQILKMVRTLLAVIVVVVLVCGVLYTQAAVTELQSKITSQRTALTEEEALSAYLSFELENMSSLKTIEEMAADMGFEKITSSQITYFRMDEDNSIRVRQDPLAQLFSGARSGLLSIWQHIDPTAP